MAHSLENAGVTSSIIRGEIMRENPSLDEQIPGGERLGHEPQCRLRIVESRSSWLVVMIPQVTDWL